MNSLLKTRSRYASDYANNFLVLKHLAGTVSAKDGGVAQSGCTSETDSPLNSYQIQLGIPSDSVRFRCHLKDDEVSLGTAESRCRKDTLIEA